MAYEKLTIDYQDNVALLTLNDPGVLNAVSMEMLRELSKAIQEIKDPAKDVRCLLMTGAGRGFCAGANLSADRFDNNDDEEVDAGQALDRYYHFFLRELRDLDFPFITAVNGAAAGVGMSFALMGDLVLASKSAYFLQAFKRIGLVPDGGATYILPRLVGLARSMELSLLAEKLPAEKALDWGLINRVYDDDVLMEHALQMAHELAHGPTVSLSMIRKLYWASPNNSYEEQLTMERISQKRAGATQDFREGVTAFIEKRPAKFKGQ